MILVYVLSGLCLLLLASTVFLLHKLVKLEKNVLVIMQVLASASPALERRVVEQGTQVIFSSIWEDTDVFEDA